MIDSQARSTSRKLSASQKMVMTAGSVSALLLVPNFSADADIVYVEDDSIFMSLVDPIGTTASWDVDGNGSTDFEFFRSDVPYIYGNYRSYLFAIRMRSLSMGGQQLGGSGLVGPADVGFEGVQALPYGVAVGPTLADGYRWGSYRVRDVMIRSSYAFTTANGSQFTGSGSGFGSQFSPLIFGFEEGDNLFGFRFVGEDGELQYGWAEINFDFQMPGVPGNITIDRWAYQTVAGQGIAVGATSSVPEPTSPLALLGLGAAGLLRFRRRKQEKARDEPVAD